MRDTTTIDRLLTTKAPVVVWNKSAVHMDNGNGFTVCGFAIPTDAQYHTGREDKRLSCLYCARQETFPQVQGIHYE